MISDKDKQWIIKKLEEHYGSKDIEWEYELIEYAIQKERPSDIRTYVETKLKTKKFDQKLSDFFSRIGTMKEGDKETGETMAKELATFLNKAEEEIPGFKKERALMISEMMGSIMAKQTCGAMGSAAMVHSMRKKEEAKNE